jgi:MGT family glycosyltransferase
MARKVKYSRKIVFNSAFAPELGLPELVACPEAFDFPRRVATANHFYIGAAVDPACNRLQGGTAFPWDRIAADRPLIFCTLGSESSYYKHSKRFFQTVIDAVAEKPEWQLVMAISNRMSADDFHGLTDNIVLVNWAPHLELLEKASVMINHGGLGTVKECILSVVPMIAFPTTADQPGNAARIAYHKLGIVGDMGKVTAAEIRTMVETVLADPSYKTRTESMLRRFKETEPSERGVEIVERLLYSGTGEKSSEIAPAAFGTL